MRRIIISLVCASVLAFNAVTPAVAKTNETCAFLGSWFGFNTTSGAVYWMSTASGASSASGTYVINIAFHPAFIQSVFPTAEKVSEFRGTWRRTAGNSFAFSAIALASDTSNQTVGVVKMSGHDTVIENCGMLEIAAQYELFFPTQNPFAESPYYSAPLPVHYGYRMITDAATP